jgi:chromosome segregation ATPase
MYVF